MLVNSECLLLVRLRVVPNLFGSALDALISDTCASDAFRNARLASLYRVDNGFSAIPEEARGGRYTRFGMWNLKRKGGRRSGFLCPRSALRAAHGATGIGRV